MNGLRSGVLPSSIRTGFRAWAQGSVHCALQVFERQYGSELESSQVYAAHKYAAADIGRMRPGRAVAAARALTPGMVTDPYDGSTRRVGPFEMLPSTAAGARP